jgi:ribonuclease P protein component
METGSEADLPAEREEAGQAPRLPRSDVDARRPGHPASPAPEGPRPAVGLTWRLRGGNRLRAVRQRGCTASAGPIQVRFLRRVTDEPPTVAYAVGRSVGSAVVRNRVRRRLRAIVATVATDGTLGAGDYLIAARPPVGERSYAQLERDLRGALAGLTPQAAS